MRTHTIILSENQIRVLLLGLEQIGNLETVAEVNEKLTIRLDPNTIDPNEALPRNLRADLRLLLLIPEKKYDRTARHGLTI